MVIEPADPKTLFHFNDPYLAPLAVLWLVCFGVAAIGILLLRAAARR